MRQARPPRSRLATSCGVRACIAPARGVTSNADFTRRAVVTSAPNGARVAPPAPIMTNRAPSPPPNYSLTIPSSTSAPVPDVPGSIFFIGTATVLIKYRGFTILTDPNFLHRGGRVHLGYGIHSTRLTEPAIGFEDLPDVDFVLLSHLHEDHFDREVEKRLDRRMPIVSTPHSSIALKAKGFLSTHALATWDRVEVKKGAARMTITAMPGKHGPPVVAALLPPVMGSMLEFDNGDGTTFRLYVSGDTLLHEQLREIPRRYPDIDLALLHLGGTRILGILVTMDAEQGVEALRLIDPKHAIPIHNDDYTVFKSPLSAFERAVEAAGLSERVTYMARGDTHRFGGARRTAELDREPASAPSVR
ncbi:MAG: fold metallo-hydrolase [Labilithrix sp.]|nr:fold metallo-hydrolase [Labilithrix sp.]